MSVQGQVKGDDWTVAELVRIITYGLEIGNEKIIRWAMVLLAIEDPDLLEKLYPCDDADD